MTEHEYIIEMLCCLPMDILKQRAAHKVQASSWLRRIDDATIQEAIDRYNEQSFTKAR